MLDLHTAGRPGPVENGGRACADSAYRVRMQWADMAAWWAGSGWPWLSDWLRSPGFAGTAAVVGAGIAFRASRNAQRLDT